MRLITEVSNSVVNKVSTTSGDLIFNVEAEVDKGSDGGCRYVGGIDGVCLRRGVW